MCKELNNVPVAVIASNGQVEPPRDGVNQSLKTYYLEQVRMLCPTTSPESPENQRLWVLLNKTKRIVSMLTLFDRQWEDGMPEMQKACLAFVVNDGLPRKERQQTADKWAEWTGFLVKAAHQRSFISQILQHYHRQLHDLERLVGREPSPFPEPIAD